MPRSCRVCIDPRLEDIDQGLASGKSVPSISREYALPESNLYRHRKDHMTIARSIDRSRPAATMALIERLELLDQQLEDMQTIAKQRGHTGAAVQALNQRFRVTMAIGALRSEVKPRDGSPAKATVDPEHAIDVAETFLNHRKTLGEIHVRKTK